ncbi:hypothetical protein BO85DRAFT_449849 [Aspergillus piperis CBS 112811]|uniref:Uncharacterized protein n=1 Tax=Aspergillus piperis CBS 112811 TaxID=1448313 RepID=A0A8G1R5F0_9EURO|nr:hypothetical protein BO85DRAFT_449849 [Aspergillus piperis CBS 112811]RAH57130.1 hypothetical protein BO85DRAFT_449849 [Aspergillus piperis CBS 112811]
MYPTTHHDLSIIIIPIKTKVIYETATKLHPETTILASNFSIYPTFCSACILHFFMTQSISKTIAVKQSKQNCITVSKRRLELNNVMKLRISSDERKFKKL